jgi:hypothetical protein
LAQGGDAGLHTAVAAWPIVYFISGDRAIPRRARGQIEL